MNRPSGSSPLPLAVLISGSGTTLDNLIRRQQDNRLNIHIRQVIASRPSAAGLRFAQTARIPHGVLPRNQYPSPRHYAEAIFDLCRQESVELVVMGGFLHLIPIPDDFQGRVMNIHPSLIPAFCGKGYYGKRVHQAVIDYGAKVSGCTVHFVDDQYDHGPIILQRAVAVRDDDTPETLAARVFAEECEAYPEAIELFAAGRLRMDGRRVHIT